MSSARNGLIPKSVGGRMALGGAGALGIAAGVRSYRNRSSGLTVTPRAPGGSPEDRDRHYMSAGGMSTDEINAYISKNPY